ncbi:MAG: cytochrome c-type biogenesis protein CcmH [Alphaproteobacteria bacterium]|nr:cytochrome c-type biogenesis protein CcmH [Alphaproteobacteria bacterium]
MRAFFIIALLTVFFGTAGTSFAVRPDEMLSDPALEARARIISKDLRCIVCQNQSIDDSDAEMAHDLRVLVRQRLQIGDSDAQVRQYIVDRYGDYVLLTPPFKAGTWLLWLGPPFFLLCAFWAAWSFCRCRKPKEDLY